jgi:hypothetical protein
MAFLDYLTTLSQLQNVEQYNGCGTRIQTDSERVPFDGTVSMVCPIEIDGNKLFIC